MAIPYSSTSALPSFLPKLVSTGAQSSMSAFVFDGSECSRRYHRLRDTAAADRLGGWMLLALDHPVV